MGQIGPEGTSEAGSLPWIISRLSSVTPEGSLEERLAPVKEEKMLVQILSGQRNLPGIEPAFTLAPICVLDAETIPSDSPFHDLFPLVKEDNLPRRRRKLTFYSFNSGDIEIREGMFLIVIKEEEPTDKEFPWNIGWVTEEEMASLFPGT